MSTETSNKSRCGRRSSHAENSTRNTPIKVGLTRWMNRPPLTTVTESGATVSPHLTRNP